MVDTAFLRGMGVAQRGRLAGSDMVIVGPRAHLARLLIIVGYAFVFYTACSGWESPLLMSTGLISWDYYGKIPAHGDTGTKPYDSLWQASILSTQQCRAPSDSKRAGPV